MRAMRSDQPQSMAPKPKAGGGGGAGKLTLPTLVSSSFFQTGSLSTPTVNKPVDAKPGDVLFVWRTEWYRAPDEMPAGGGWEYVSGYASQGGSSILRHNVSADTPASWVFPQINPGNQYNVTSAYGVLLFRNVGEYIGVINALRVPNTVMETGFLIGMAHSRDGNFGVTPTGMTSLYNPSGYFYLGVQAEHPPGPDFKSTNMHWYMKIGGVYR